MVQWNNSTSLFKKDEAKKLVDLPWPTTQPETGIISGKVDWKNTIRVAIKDHNDSLPPHHEVIPELANIYTVYSHIHLKSCHAYSPLPLFIRTTKNFYHSFNSFTHYFGQPEVHVVPRWRFNQ